MSRIPRLGILLALLVPLGLPTPASAAEPPIAYYTDTGVAVAELDGTVLASLPDFQFFSLDGTLLAGSTLRSGKGERVVGHDATTGQRLFRIKDAFAPIALADGRKVGFLPDRFAHRDPYFASVWIRNQGGRERAVVRFAGPKRTVNPKDFEGEGIPLDQAWDDEGRTLAVTFGNDVDLFIYDVWVVDARTRDATRITRGQASRFPSLSPSGDRLALFREREDCGGPDPGYRAGDLRTMSSTGADRAVLVEGTCDLFYTDPRWISEDELVAARLTRQSPGVYDVDLVRIVAATGAVTEIVTGGDVGFFNVSSALQLVAFERRDVFPGFFVYDLDAGTTTSSSEGYLPHLAGAHRLI
jgi:hypothetical protein